MRRISAVVAVAAAAALPIAVAGADAAIPAPGTIVACVHHGDGGFYKARRCAHKDARMTWNARGPAGRDGREGHDGRDGPEGRPGPPGPRGPSDAYSSETGGTTPLYLPGDQRTVTVRTVSVPAGSYLVLAKLELVNANAGPANVRCAFADDADENNALLPGANGFGPGMAEITLQHAQTLAAAGTISVECSASGPGSHVITSFDKLTALAVGALH
jgi:hypothetical protein